MGQQVVNGDFLRHLFGKPGFIQISAEGVVRIYFSFFNQLHDGDRSEHFVHGAEVELGVDVVGDMETFAGFAGRGRVEDV